MQQEKVVSFGNRFQQAALMHSLAVPIFRIKRRHLNCSQADYIVEADDDLETIGELPADETVQAISRSIVDQVPDGATIQLGLGGLACAVGYGLAHKNDLGIHSELMSDVMMYLMKKGVVTNRCKTYLPGKSVASFAFGSKELYRYMDHNPDFYFMPFAKVNDPVTIAKNDNMISTNTAMSIDLLGKSLPTLSWLSPAKRDS